MSLNDLILKLENYDSSNPDLQLYTSIELGKLVNNNNRDQIIQALVSLLNDKKFPACTRAHAVEELSKIKNEKVKQSLRLALKDPYRLVRSYALRALGNYKDKELIDDLTYVGLSNSEYFGVMAESAEALKKICLDVLEKDHNDQQCLYVMNETIPKIQEKANQKRTQDDRYVKRVGFETLQAKVQLSNLIEEYNKNMSEMLGVTKSMNIQEEAKKIKNDEREYEKFKDELKNVKYSGLLVSGLIGFYESLSIVINQM